MGKRTVHKCECAICQHAKEHPDKKHHHRMNLLMSRMDEQQRRWYAATEAEKIGHGGDVQISQITGLHVDTIRRGRTEMDQELEGRPDNHVRLPGGGRPRTEKKTQA